MGSGYSVLSAAHGRQSTILLIAREEGLMAERVRQIVSEALQKGLLTPEGSPSAGVDKICFGFIRAF